MSPMEKIRIKVRMKNHSLKIINLIIKMIYLNLEKIWTKNIYKMQRF
jgi:hypothetical protein